MSGRESEAELRALVRDLYDRIAVLELSVTRLHAITRSRGQKPGFGLTPDEIEEEVDKIMTFADDPIIHQEDEPHFRTLIGALFPRDPKRRFR